MHHALAPEALGVRATTNQEARNPELKTLRWR
jgi:hypothetical protein